MGNISKLTLMDNSNWIKMGNNCPHARIALNNSIKFRFYCKRAYITLLVMMPIFAVTRWVKYENVLSGIKPNVSLYQVRADLATGNLTTYETEKGYRLSGS